jgi:hypothetical protein
MSVCATRCTTVVSLLTPPPRRRTPHTGTLDHNCPKDTQVTMDHTIGRLVPTMDAPFTSRVMSSRAVALALILCGASSITPANAQAATCPVWDLVTGADITGAVSADNTFISSPGFGSFSQCVSLSYDGSIVAVGEPGHSSKTGRVRVYALSGSTQWEQLGSDIVSASGSIDAQFGLSVSLAVSGSGVKYVAAGEPFAKTSGFFFGGRAAVYSFDGTAWTLFRTPLGGSTFGGLLGCSVSLSLTSTDVFVAIGEANAGGSGGSAKVFRSTSTAWEQVGVSIQPGNDAFGTAVSLVVSGSGDRFLAVGCPACNDQRGETYSYFWNETAAAWEARGPIITNPTIGSESGTSVSLSANGAYLAIGEPIGASGKGCVRVFVFNETGTSDWTLHGSAILGDASGDKFGESVSLSDDGNRLTVGAPKGNGNQGYSRVYEWDSAEWRQYGIDINGGAGQRLGQSVAISGEGSIVAAALPDSGAGVTRVYDLTPCPTAAPTTSPTSSPTASPTRSPTDSPTASPTLSPTTSPTSSPHHPKHQSPRQMMASEH